MAKKSRLLVSHSVLAPKLVLPSPLEERPTAPPTAGTPNRYRPPSSFAVHARQTPLRVTSFASRRRNH